MSERAALAAAHLAAADALEREARDRLKAKTRDSHPGAVKPDVRAAEANALATLALGRRIAAHTVWGSQ